MNNVCTKVACDSGASKRDKLISLIAVAALVGIIVSIYSTLEHYELAPSDICTIGETFNCDVVNGSAYSKIFGIPVAILGVLAYLALFAGIMIYDRNKSEKLFQLLMMLGAGGLIFSLYLTSIEAFVLYTWCLLCLASQAAILVIAGSLYKLQKLEQL